MTFRFKKPSETTPRTSWLRWSPPVRCSICTDSIPFGPITLSDPPNEWILCKCCHEVLLKELRRSTINMPTRLQIAMGLVAAERSPHAYPIDTHFLGQRTLQRELALIVRFMVLFALLHAAIFAIILALPK